MMGDLPGAGGLETWVDGRSPLTAKSVAAITAVCDRALGGGPRTVVIVHVSGFPPESPAGDLGVGLVSKWERALRRLEHLPLATIGVADGDCGGLALDALLATDYRIASHSAQLLLPMTGGATWPGMALYRLARQAGGSAIRRAILFGAPIKARDALDLQLVDELTGDLAAAVGAVAGMAASLPGTELAIRRQLMFEASTTSFEDALGAHLAACDRSLRLATAEAER